MQQFLPSFRAAAKAAFVATGLATLAFLATPAIAQTGNKTTGNDWCGTPADSATERWLSQVMPQRATVTRKTQVVTYVPLVFHLVAQSNGTGRLQPQEVIELICDLNAQYSQSNIQYYLKPWSQTGPARTGLFHEINSSFYYNMPDKSDSYTLMNTNNDINATNVYVMQSCGVGLCGFAYFPSSFIPKNGGLFLSMGSGCLGPGSTTAAHELGHYFGLPHTFGNSSAPKEFVDGSNCTVAGDYFCDTEADNLPARWNCPYTGPTGFDPKGDPYSPDPTFYMSYSSDNCQTRFSQEQMNAMDQTLALDRPYLVTASNPPAALNTAPVIMDPAPNSDWTPFNAVIIRWKSVAGALGYRVRLTRLNQTPLDIFTTDTVYTAPSLFRGFSYDLEISAVNGNTFCVPAATANATFKTTWALGIEDGLTRSTSGSAVLVPSLLYAGQPLRMETAFATAERLSLQIIGMDGRTVHTYTRSVGSGTQLTEITVPTLPAGQYMLRYTGETQLGVLRFGVAN